MLKGFKIRIYPNKEQVSLINMHFDACRFMWNYMLEVQKENYKNGGKYIRKCELSKLMTKMINSEENLWLKKVSYTSLQRECSELDIAFTRFFTRLSRYPKNKSKKSNYQSYPVRINRFYFTGNCISVEKIGKIRYKSDFKFKNGRNIKYCNVYISRKNNKYFVSFSVERENQTFKLNDYSMGIDLGIKKLAVVAYGNSKMTFDNINKSKKMKALEKRIRHFQRSLSRKHLKANRDNKGKLVKSSNALKQELRLAKLYSRRSNIKDNYIHQTTHTLIAKLPKRVVMEHLVVSNMTKNRQLSKFIQEQCFNKFFRYMEYKCAWYGIEFIRADMFYPSSKTCSCCGVIKRNLKLSDRIFKCHKCGTVIDRDLNAAINLMRYEA